MHVCVCMVWFQIPVAERGELVRQGELTVCGGARRKRAGVRNVFLYQHVVIFTKQKSPGPGRTAYSYKHSIKVRSPHTLTHTLCLCDTLIIFSFSFHSLSAKSSVWRVLRKIHFLLIKLKANLDKLTLRCWRFFSDIWEENTDDWDGSPCSSPSLYFIFQIFFFSSYTLQYGAFQLEFFVFVFIPVFQLICSCMFSPLRRVRWVWLRASGRTGWSLKSGSVRLLGPTTASRCKRRTGRTERPGLMTSPICCGRTPSTTQVQCDLWPQRPQL